MEEYEDKPSCSMLVQVQDKELKELTSEQGINVWGTNQTVLEAQALHELETFSQKTTADDNILEEGEVIDQADKKVAYSLDISAYIKRQEELHRIQECMNLSTKSKEAANKLPECKEQQTLQKRQHAISRDKKDRVKRAKKDNSVNDKHPNSSGSEYFPSDDEIDSDNLTESYLGDRVLPVKRRKSNTSSNVVEKVKDDGCFSYYKTRLEEYYKMLDSEKCLETEDEPEVEYYTIKGGLKVLFKIWNNLYSYQQDGVRWLWQVHEKNTGGILGDEMGLGKTVQVIAFLSGLEYSKTLSCHNRGLGATLIVCPATVMHQWVKHFHDWAPEFRVAILHQSGTYPGHKSQLIKEMNKANGILITSYSGVLKYKTNLLDYNWHYLILDEGHKIRNPNAKVTVALNEIRTPHRLMLTGSPMQNNLQELWSLFDFTNPGILGNLPTFMEHFNNPIIQGGFANSTPMQEATALSVATTLKNVITPYLLRRTKSEVQDDINLPNKSEQVLFCSLTAEQRDLYKNYLMSDHIGSVLGKDNKHWFADNQSRASVLVGITTLRKICNHPDLYLCIGDDQNQADDILPIEESRGSYKKSGKMIVVSALLKIWKKQKHRVLLFTQSRFMIRIFENFLQENNYNFLKMDGGTSINSRQTIINKFNEDTMYDVFLLTTRVGGLGVNLTGADRVIIYDPDWNPATDTQARERAWRIGQDKQVTIYRLLSAGTIEEKMYQRQIWKQLLSNKVLIDPRTQKFFKSSNLHDLFSLSENADANTETANIFRESRVKLEERLKERSKKKKVEKDVHFSADKIQAMRDLAQQISKSLTNPDKIEQKKTIDQIELEVERQKKLKEKEELKQLTPMEIIYYNRDKSKHRKEVVGNQIDGCETVVSFDKALDFSENRSKMYNELRAEKIKNLDKVIEKNYRINPETSSKNHRHKKSDDKDMFKSVIDESGIVEGEKVDGLIKSEVKKMKRKHEKLNKNLSQDQYVLSKLFAKKGVSGALQHDSIIESGITKQSLKVQSEADMRAHKALEAIRKSRLDNWRW